MNDNTPVFTKKLYTKEVSEVRDLRAKKLHEMIKKLYLQPRLKDETRKVFVMHIGNELAWPFS